MDTICIEAGNSRVKFGLFRNNKLQKVFSVSHKDGSLPEIPSELRKITPQYIALASVVPHLNGKIKKKIRDIYGKKLFIIKPSECGLPLKIKNPEKVGIDRVLNCKAAISIFGSTVIVVDAGTAITVDIASETQGFMGGVILPGMELWVNSLKNTAMMKGIRPSSVKFPGRNTNEAVRAGLKYGMEGALKNILDIAFRKYPSARLVLTGGGSGMFANRLNREKKIRRNLTMEGLGMVLKERPEKS